jgi:biopolymer transport protein ExbB
MEINVNRTKLATSMVCVLLLLPTWTGLPAQAQTTDDTTAPAAAAPTPDGASGDAPAPEAAPEGFFDIVFSGGWTGFLIVMVLLALSLTAAYLVFEHVMTLRASELMPEGLASRARDLLVAGRIREAEEACRQQPSFLSFVLLSGLAEVDGGWQAVEKALEDALAEQSARLFRKIEYLSVIANIAPMIGLLGTVTGMIFAFQQVASTQGAAGAGQLAEGIYQALVTTVGGLLVAIPSLGAFAILRNRGDQLVAEAAYMAQHVFTPVKRRRGPAVPPSGPTPPPPPPAPGE